MGELVVDVANLVGSRPDGWWRDRLGATERTLAWLPQLLGRDLGPAGTITSVTAVVEGAARAARAPESIRVLRTDRGQAGDDLIVTHTHRPGGGRVWVVTADRGLRARLPQTVAVLGPGTLLRLRQDG